MYIQWEVSCLSWVGRGGFAQLNTSLIPLMELTGRLRHGHSMITAEVQGNKWHTWSPQTWDHYLHCHFCLIGLAKPSQGKKPDPWSEDTAQLPGKGPGEGREEEPGLPCYLPSQSTRVCQQLKRSMGDIKEYEGMETWGLEGHFN